MDIFDVDDPLPADSPPWWLLSSIGSSQANNAPTTGTGFAQLPSELLPVVLSWLPSYGLASICAVASWLGALSREAAIAAIARLEVTLPALRLGEGWPCALKRAELRAASRRSALASVGFSAIAWISPRSHEPRFLRWASAPDSTRDSFIPWRPTMLPRNGRRVTAVSCGSMHVLILLEDGEALVMGVPTGRARDEAVTLEPRVLRRGGADETTVGVAAGAFHSLLVGSRGSLWSCGANALGQLGLGHFEDSGHARDMMADRGSDAAQPVAMASHRGLQASGGGHHSLVLTQSGGVLSFGGNSSGQLGLGDTTNRCSPCRVPLPGGEVACAVAAGGDCSMVLSEAGEIFGFGSALYGALGVPPETIPGCAQRLPARVPVLGSNFNPVIVRQVAAGYDHVLARTADGQVFSWGAAGRRWTKADAGDGWLGGSRGAGQLARALSLHICLPSDEHAYSSSAGPASALGRCSLVAAGSHCSLGVVLPHDVEPHDVEQHDVETTPAAREHDAHDGGVSVTMHEGEVVLAMSARPR